MTPTIGRIVLYMLNEVDAEAINRRRDDAAQHISEHRERADGSMVHVGNHVTAGEQYPAVVVRVWSTAATTANLQVLLDGSDTYWATSRQEGDAPGWWAWPERV